MYHYRRYVVTSKSDWNVQPPYAKLDETLLDETGSSFLFPPFVARESKTLNLSTLLAAQTKRRGGSKSLRLGMGSAKAP